MLVEPKPDAHVARTATAQATNMSERFGEKVTQEIGEDVETRRVIALGGSPQVVGIPDR